MLILGVGFRTTPAPAVLADHTQSGSIYELFVQSTNPAASPPPVARHGSQSDRLYANQQLTKNQALTRHEQRDHPDDAR